MFTIHDEYAEEQRPTPFVGDRAALRPGAYLGRNDAQYRLLRAGDIVTSVRDGEESHYFYDPGLRIAGTSYIKVDVGHVNWQRITR